APPHGHPSRGPACRPARRPGTGGGLALLPACNWVFSPHVERTSGLRGRYAMQTPLKIGFHGSAPSDALTQMITDHVGTLEHVFGRMTACQVKVQVPDRLNGPYSVHIHMTVPGGGDLNIDHAPPADERFFDAQFAVNDA